MILRYAEVQNKKLIKYPYLFSDLQEDNPNTNYGNNYDVAYWFPMTSIAIENGYTLAPVNELPQPSFNPATQNCTLQTTPVLKNGVWNIDWVVTDKTPEEIAAELDLWRQSTFCTPFQGRMALSNADYLSQVEAIINDPNTPKETKIAWEYAIEWKRMSPMIVNLASTLGMTDEEVDQLFRDAQQITA